MQEEIRQINNSLTDEEKEKLRKCEKKGITQIIQKVDQRTGEIVSTETSYNSEMKRKKGSFGISSPEEIIKLAQQVSNRAYNKMLVYILNTMDWNNEFTFNEEFKNSYGKNVSRFYTDRKTLIDDKVIFKKQNEKNIYTLNVNLFFRGQLYKATELYEEQFGTEYNQDTNIILNKLKRSFSKLKKEDLQNLVDYLSKLL